MKSSSYFVSMQERRRQRVILRIKRFLIALIIFNIVTMLFVRFYRLPNEIMKPAIEKGSTLVVSPSVYGPRVFGVRLFSLSSPERGDIVLFISPFWKKDSSLANFFNNIVDYLSAGKLHLGKSWEGKYQIRRIVAVPGDQIYIKENIAYIRPKGKKEFIREDFLIDYPFNLKKESGELYFDKLFSYLRAPVTLGDGEFFVMSDNRNMVMDSRIYGPVSMESFRGKVVWKFKL